MATVHHFLPSIDRYQAVLQIRLDLAEAHRNERFKAVILLQRMTRGYLIRKHIAWLSHNALIIQSAFRLYRSRKYVLDALKLAVQKKHEQYYAAAATKIQALWRGYYSRRKNFCYRSYRRWLAVVCEKSQRRAAEAREFGIRSRNDDLKILEEEARQWLAFVIFKLHHLLRTFVCAGVYSSPNSTELSDFEKLLTSIHYCEYMKRLKRKYNEFVKKHRPMFSNKRLFPIIGDGADYWYLSLPEMYELSAPVDDDKMNTRHKMSHHGAQHKTPFMWKRYRPDTKEDRGPFKPDAKITRWAAPPPTPSRDGDVLHKDPIFHLYMKHYTPQPDLFDYVDYHINVLLKRKQSVERMRGKRCVGKYKNL